jgi:hypothetical protein
VDGTLRGVAGGASGDCVVEEFVDLVRVVATNEWVRTVEVRGSHVFSGQAPVAVIEPTSCRCTAVHHSPMKISRSDASSRSNGSGSGIRPMGLAKHHALTFPRGVLNGRAPGSFLSPVVRSLMEHSPSTAISRENLPRKPRT